MAGLDDLNMDAQNEAGATPPVEAVTGTGYDLVEQSLPDSEHKLLGRWVQRYKLSDDDPMMGQYLTARVAFSSAAAAGAAAQAVQSSVAGIPDQIFKGAIRAGDEIKGALASEIRGQGVEVGQALKLLIDTSAQKGAASLKTAAVDLDLKMAKIPADVQKSLDAYRDKGVGEFALAAQRAGEKAARTALVAQLSRSAMVSILAFLFATMIGAGGLWGFLLITHRVMPQGVVAMADPLRGGDLLIVPTGGTPLPPSQCPGGLCLVYKGGLPDLP
jgi:hypothetical protein